MSCGIGRRGGLDLALLWLWCRSAAIAPIRPLAWVPPYTMGAALKKTKKKKIKKAVISSNLSSIYIDKLIIVNDQGLCDTIGTFQHSL